ncbi:conserved hypothetical protein [Syntrophobacter sp. SbD2]|nr:conserved hypothetical protein [Syntrophobacter sp. SbD2]
MRYEKPLESVKKAVDLCGGLDHLPSRAKVFVKPNIVLWTRLTPFPKWGVITTSRVINDMVCLLKERGIDDITIGEGTVVYDPKDRETAAHAFETLGYGTLKRRYGVKSINVFERPFEKVDLGGGVKLAINTDILNSDFVVNVPVMKTHAQTVVSLGIKNIKGTIDIKSRKKCHSADPEKDLHYMVSKLANKIPPSFTIIDGIYTNERGPSFDGKIRRSNLLVASADVLSADKVGATILGYQPAQVPHLVHAAKDMNRTQDLSDLQIVGETIENVAMKLEYAFAYTEDGTLPAPMAKMGIQGLTYPKYDSSLCTYCSGITGAVLTAIAYAWKGQPWDDVEIISGKMMKPTPGRKTTVLLGKCMYVANKNNPDIKNMIAVKTCPPAPEAVVKALHQAGIEVSPEILKTRDKTMGSYMKRYEGKPEFDESLFRID